jgi:hypothetical protein
MEEAAISRLVVTMNTAEIQKMSPSEGLRTMAALCHESEEPPSPEWHAEVLAGKKLKLQVNEEKSGTGRVRERKFLGFILNLALLTGICP